MKKIAKISLRNVGRKWWLKFEFAPEFESKFEPGNGFAGLAWGVDLVDENPPGMVFASWAIIFQHLGYLLTQTRDEKNFKEWVIYEK